MAADPINQFRRWFKQARDSGIELADAFALATSDSRGRPSVRFVLLKHADRDGFVFYTNTLSRKGKELDRNPYAALAFYWHETGKQVRVEGKVALVTDAEADAYWLERPAGSRLAAAASRQSAKLTDRRELTKTYKRLERAHADGEIVRPDHWTGYRLAPSSIEFWTRREPRLHHRELFEKTRTGWRKTLLQP